MFEASPFKVIPAVDVQRGRAVRLYEGDPERETVYFADPLVAAEHWTSLGAELLHLVDLDATLESGSNSALIERIATTVAAKVELGGGIRSAADAERWLRVVDRVILGTVAVREPDLISELVERHGPERVSVSVDARAGKVAVRGWAEATEVDAAALAEDMFRRGVRHLIYTDVSRDGTMQGVDESAVAELRGAFAGDLVAGGGVGSDADLELYQALGLQGAIVGRALYEGKITYPRAA